MNESEPSLTADLTWQADLRFSGRSGGAAMALDSQGRQGPSPVQALAFGLASCMAIDVVQILTKARLPLRGLEAHLSAWRAPQEPRRFTRIELHFRVKGDVPSDRVERAIALSREKYCSVWHSLRQDIDLRTSQEVVEGP